MGTTGSHLPCFVPKDTAQWQVLLYHERSTSTTMFAKKRGIGKNRLVTVRTVVLTRASRHGGG